MWLYNSKDQVLGLFQWLNLAVNLSALVSLAIYYGYDHSAETAGQLFGVVKFSFGFSLRQCGAFIVIFIVSHISGLPLKFSLPGSSRRILVHGFRVEFLSASAGNIILIGWPRYLADLAAYLGGLAALAGGAIAAPVAAPFCLQLHASCEVSMNERPSGRAPVHL